MSTDPKSPINWHFLPWDFELRTDSGVQQGDRDVLHQDELPAGAQVAVRGEVKTFVYVIHIGQDRKVTQLYPAAAAAAAEELDADVSTRLPAEPGSFLTTPSAGVVRVVVSQQEIRQEDWAQIGVLDGREPPPKGVR